ncbi:MAG TPA: helix-turn-helix transcriptional regulator [Pseudomonas sp.]
MFLELCGWKGLTNRGLAPRELQCVLAIASGKTVKETAKTLGVSPSSTAKRISSAMFKLGVNRQAAMVAKAVAMGLISFSAGMLPTPQGNQQGSQHEGVFIA